MWGGGGAVASLLENSWLLLKGSDDGAKVKRGGGQGEMPCSMSLSLHCTHETLGHMDTL